MKKLVCTFLAASLLLMFAACGGAQGSIPAQSSQAPTEPPAIDPSINVAELTALLADERIPKVKAYFKTTKSDGTTGEASDNASYALHDIELLRAQITESGNITAVLTAELKNQARYIEGRQDIRAHFVPKESKNGGYKFSSMQLMYPDDKLYTHPTVPFSNDVIFDMATTLDYEFNNAFLDEHRERILFNDSVTLEEWHTNSVDWRAFVPVTRENVKSIEWLPRYPDDISWWGSEFEISSKFKFTLQNDVVVYSYSSIEHGFKGWQAPDRGFRALIEDVEGL